MIQGTKVVLRPLKGADMEKMQQWDNDSELNYLMNDSNSDKTTDVRTLRRNSKVMAISTVDGLLIGHLELNQISWRSRNAELVIRIGDKNYWGKGYGRDAVITLLRYTFLQMNLRQVYLRVYRFNTRAVRCYEHCGFKKEGFVRRRYDDGVDGIDLILMTISVDEFLKENSKLVS